MGTHRPWLSSAVLVYRDVCLPGHTHQLWNDAMTACRDARVVICRRFDPVGDSHQEAKMSISSTGATPPQGTSSQTAPARANGTWRQADPGQPEGKPALSAVTETFDKIGQALPGSISLGSVIP